MLGRPVVLAVETQQFEKESAPGAVGRIIAHFANQFLNGFTSLTGSKQFLRSHSDARRYAT